MKISDLLRLSADNLRRRKGRTALTVIGVVVGTFAIIVLISLGIASNANNEAMLQSWGDLTQIQIWNYAYGSVGETPKLDDEMLETIRAQEHVVAATPFYSSNEINASIYAGKNERYEAYFYESYGVDMTALQAMEFQLQSGSWIPDDLNLGKKKIPVLVGANMGYGFQDTRKSWNSGKRQRWAGETDSLGNPVPPFVDVEKDKLTLRLRLGIILRLGIGGNGRAVRRGALFGKDGGNGAQAAQQRQRQEYAQDSAHFLHGHGSLSCFCQLISYAPVRWSGVPPAQGPPDL